MISRRLLLRIMLVLVLGAVAFAAWADRPDAADETDASKRQLLVMLRLPPPHFRPDANYLGSYDTQFGRGARQRVADELAARFKLRIVGSWPMPLLGVDCFVMEAENATIGPLVDEIAQDWRVESIQSMNVFHTLSQDDPLYPLQPTQKLWHLDELHQIATGRNIRVAAIDSGVELDHPDLRDRVVIARNFVDARNGVAETHGTAVAGIIAARANNGVGIVGVAPDAALLALRACWETPADRYSAICSSFTLAKALQFALDKNARVINLSLSGPRDQLLGRLLDIAKARRVVVVAAADPHLPDGGFPASFPGVLAVASDDAQDSSTETLLAPGQDIPTTLPGHRFGFVGGPSFAAAQVTGLVALLFDIAPNQTPEKIREILHPPAALASSTRHHALVDACASVARTAATCACGCSTARATGQLTAR